MGRGTAWIGIVVFAVAWFLPVHSQLDAQSQLGSAFKDFGSELEKTVSDDSEGPRASTSASHAGGLYAGPPGWQAFRVAWDLLTSKSGDRNLKSTLLGLTSVTNGVMVAAIVALLLGAGAGTLRGVGKGLFACAVLNLGWAIWSGEGIPSGLRVGYWLWVASFAFVGLSFTRATE